MNSNIFLFAKICQDFMDCSPHYLWPIIQMLVVFFIPGAILFLISTILFGRRIKLSWPHERYLFILGLTFLWAQYWILSVPLKLLRLDIPHFLLYYLAGVFVISITLFDNVIPRKITLAIRIAGIIWLIGYVALILLNIPLGDVTH